MPHCVIINCDNEKNTYAEQEISYYSFPQDPYIKERWIAATGRKDWLPTKQSSICSLHFENNSFIEGKELRMLKNTAYPTINISKHIDSDDENKDTTQRPSSSLRKRKLVKEMEIQPSTSKQKCVKKNFVIKRINSLAKRNEQNKLMKRREQNLRRVKRVFTIKTILRILKDKFLINDEQASLLQCTEVTNRELYSIQQKSKNTCNTSIDSQTLRTFALTLYYYSSKAYSYARNVFNLALPHPNAIYKWNKSENGSAGFTSESLRALKFIAKSKNPLYCCLMIDEMEIRKNVKVYDGKLYGYEDFGSGLDTDAAPESKEALVMFVTGINANWKVPVGYFLVDRIISEQKADLVLQCLRHLHDSDINVVCLTFTGYPSYLTMAKLLGCQLDPNEIKNTFEHPVTKQPVAIFLDPSQMMKLIRHCLRANRKIGDSNGKFISWENFDLQRRKMVENVQNIHVVDKLKAQNVKFNDQKMNVKSATQLLSKNIADLSKESRGISYFDDMSATTEFITIFNDLFDVLMSRNMKKIGYNQPLNMSNKETVMNLFAKAEKYIKGLKTLDGDLVTKRHKGFIGLLVCIETVKTLYKNLIEGDKIQFLSMYQFSLNHLEMFFSNARAHCGNKNDPTPRQFESFYKKILGHVEIKNCNKNRVDIGKVSILNCSTEIETINKTTHEGLYIDDDNFDDNKEPNRSNGNDFDDFLKALPQNTEFFDKITYIAGYVVRVIRKQIKCDECNNALSLEKPAIVNTYESVIFKDESGSVHPTKDVIKICKVADFEIRNINNKARKFNIEIAKIFNIKISKELEFRKPFILNKILRYFVNKNVFDSIADHQFDQSPTESHLVNLIKIVAGTYIDLCLD